MVSKIFFVIYLKRINENKKKVFFLFNSKFAHERTNELNCCCCCWFDLIWFEYEVYLSFIIMWKNRNVICYLNKKKIIIKIRDECEWCVEFRLLLLLLRRRSEIMLLLLLLLLLRLKFQWIEINKKKSEIRKRRVYIGTKNVVKGWIFNWIQSNPNFQLLRRKKHNKKNNQVYLVE